LSAAARRADHEGLLGQVIGRNDIKGLFEIDHVDLVGVDELGQLERLLALELDRLQLFVVEQDIAALLILVALDDLVGVDRPMPGTIFSYLIRLPLGSWIWLKATGRAALGGRVDFDRDRDQAS
jgi:hypothetical protein